MLPTIIISVLTCILLICSILFFPKIKIKEVEIDTYWIVCLIGAIAIILFNCVSAPFFEFYHHNHLGYILSEYKITILIITYNFGLRIAK